MTERGCRVPQGGNTAKMAHKSQACRVNKEKPLEYDMILEVALGMWSRHDQERRKTTDILLKLSLPQ